MSDEDGGPADAVEQGGAGGLDGSLLVNGVRNKLDVGGVEGVKDRVPHGAISWPLRVMACLGPEHVAADGREALLDGFGRVRGRARGAVAGLPRGAATERLVHDVYVKTLFEEPRGPAASAVRLVQVVLSGTASARGTQGNSRRETGPAGNGRISQS